jgi:DNA repair exonuclease SbcCD ATPase subunit
MGELEAEDFKSGDEGTGELDFDNRERMSETLKALMTSLSRSSIS